MVAREMLRGRNYLALRGCDRCTRRLPRERRPLLPRPRRLPVHVPGSHATGSGRADALQHTRHVDGQRGVLPARLRRRPLGRGPSSTSARTSGSARSSSSPATRTRGAWLYEPVPRNVERLRANLPATRTATRCARRRSAPSGGTRQLRRRGERPLRRHRRRHRPGHRGHLPRRSTRCSTRCSSRSRSSTCSRSTPRARELEILGAIRPELLAAVRTVYLEVASVPRTRADGFDDEFHNETWVLRNAASPRSAEQLVGP